MAYDEFYKYIWVQNAENVSQKLKASHDLWQIPELLGLQDLKIMNTT